MNKVNKLGCIQLVKRYIPLGVKARIRQILNFLQVLYAKFAQSLVLARIRRKLRDGNEPIKVVFLVSEISKWKCQSLYDLMKAHPRFEPVIGIFMQDEGFESKDAAIIRAGMERAKQFFDKRGCKVVELYDSEKLQPKDLQVEKPDIIFYQQPWNIILDMSPMAAAKYAITCYVSYYVPNYHDPSLSYSLLFHRYLKYNFILNGGELSYASSIRRFWNIYAGHMVVVGHPMLDEFYLNPPNPALWKCVIYAPHFTFKHPNNPVLVHYSTFLDNGPAILKYAQAHPEMNWVFKPHPRLKIALRMPGIWSEHEIDDYYGAWAKIGRVCEDGDYMKLFREARAMITDCGSFLSEFAVTKQPIIHLINPENNLAKPELFDTYYKVHNQEELKATLKRVLEDGDDYNMAERLQALEKANLTGTYAAKNIMDFFAKEFRIKE